jgi:hypothetical protein
LKRVSAIIVFPTSIFPWPEYPPLIDDMRIPSLDANASITSWPTLLKYRECLGGNTISLAFGMNLCLAIGYGRLPNPAIKRLYGIFYGVVESSKLMASTNTTI